MTLDEAAGLHLYEQARAVLDQSAADTLMNALLAIPTALPPRTTSPASPTSCAPSSVPATPTSSARCSSGCSPATPRSSASPSPPPEWPDRSRTARRLTEVSATGGVYQSSKPAPGATTLDPCSITPRRRPHQRWHRAAAGRRCDRTASCLVRRAGGRRRSLLHEGVRRRPHPSDPAVLRRRPHGRIDDARRLRDRRPPVHGAERRARSSRPTRRSRSRSCARTRPRSTATGRRWWTVARSSPAAGSGIASTSRGRSSRPRSTTCSPRATRPASSGRRRP